MSDVSTSDSSERSVEPEAPGPGPSRPATAILPAPKKRFVRRVLGWSWRGGMGLALGLAMAEGGFWWRDHGAFPHLNVYEPDDALGLRLRPGATERLAFGKNPLTHIRIGAQGFRGAGLPAPVGGEIIVVGDSQVFGLGVEENETASARLSTLLGKTVINAGIPTYGPAEYNQVVTRLLEQYEPSTVVYVVNFANDPFEASHPNTERHAEWDGWAVRKETAPMHVASFPGRQLIYRDSHAVYALRSLLYAHGPQLDDQGFGSEGSVADLVGATRAEHERAEVETKALAERHDREIAGTAAKELESEIALEDAALDAFDLRGYELGIAYKQSRDNPGDIVLTTYHTVEEERGPPRTFQWIVNGAKVRREMEERIRAVAERKVALEEAKAAKLTLSLEERDALRKRLDDLKKAPAEIVRAWSPMTPWLRDVKAACDARGARLLVVALPLDLQVSADERAKYGPSQEVVDGEADAESTKLLFDDLVASAEALGALGLDATPALRAAEPGAFLDGDIHMTPKGQNAFAEAIAERLK